MSKIGLKNNKEITELQPILENVAMNFTSPCHSRSGSVSGSENKIGPSLELNIEKLPSSTTSLTKTAILNEATENLKKKPPIITYTNLHEQPLSQLLKELQESREEKRHLRRVLRTFEVDFEKKTGRRVEKTDRVHMEIVYSNYKVI